MARPATKAYNYLRRMGFKVDAPSIADKTIRDYMGLFNILGVHPDKGWTLAVHACDEKELPDAIKRVLGSKWTPVLLSGRWYVEIHGWGMGILDPHIVRVKLENGRPTIA